jgi:protein TonB
MFLMFAPEAQILHRAPVDYPRDAIAKNVQGTVTVEVNIDENGLVTDAHVVSGPMELRSAALKSVLDWHFSKQMGLPTVTQVPVEFRLPPNGPAKPVMARRLAMPTKIENEPVRGISIEGLSGPARDTLLQQLPVREGDMLTAELFQRVLTEVESFDQHLRPTLIRQAGGVTIDIAPRGGEGTFTVGGGVAPSTPAQIRVGGNVQQMKLLQHTRPVYPPEAKAAGIQGMVRFNTTIGADGHVKNLQVVSGDPALVPAAMDAVRQWVWEPTKLNGNLVEVVTQIDVNFTLMK